MNAPAFMSKTFLWGQYGTLFIIPFLMYVLFLLVENSVISLVLPKQEVGEECRQNPRLQPSAVIMEISLA